MFDGVPFDVNIFAGFSIRQVHHARRILTNDHRAEFGNNLHHQSGDVACNSTAQMFARVWAMEGICPSDMR